jgi:hypothetical protein
MKVFRSRKLLDKLVKSHKLISVLSIVSTIAKHSLLSNSKHELNKTLRTSNEDAKAATYSDAVFH